MEKRRAPIDAYTKFITGPRHIVAIIPKSTKMINATNKMVLRAVKSNFVWNANNVNAKQTAAVIPIANST